MIGSFKKFSFINYLTKSQPFFAFGGGHHDFDRTAMRLNDPSHGYYLDPNETARRTMRIIMQHDKVADPESLTLNSQWFEMGLNQLDTVELLVGIEDQFKIQFPDDVAEKFKDINDVVQYVSRSFWSE